MKKFNYTGETIPQESREELNTTILNLISNNGDMQGITQEDIFNAYTGIGGLHGLNRNSFKNYHDYATAKKDFEQGQFFTPHSICESIAELIEPKPSDVIADITCGMGNFFNYFTESNCYGCEIDINAVSVANYLYPNANIERKDFRFYSPDIGMDFILGNPPFNLKMSDPKGGKYDTITSQHYFFRKCYELLNPASIVIAVVPTSFLKDEFFNKSIIEDINNMFDFIGQIPLKDNAFTQMSVDNFSTKIMCFQKRSESMEITEYKCDEFMTYETLKFEIQKRIKEKEANKLKLRKELLLNDDNTEFIYKVNKYLYEIKTHPSLQIHSEKAIKYVDKYYNQKCPEGEDYNHWFKYSRITKNKVISYLKRFIKKQNNTPKNIIRVVKSNNVIKLKGYDNKTRKEVSSMAFSSWNINDMVTGDIDIPVNIPKNYRKLIEKKQKAYKLQNTPFNKLKEDTKVNEFINNFTFLNRDNEVCYLNDVQRGDLKLICQKQYSIIAWQQGGGKTCAFYAWSKYKTNNKNTVIIAPSLAINLTWKPFLETNNENCVVIKKLADLEGVKDDDYILLSFHYISKYKRQLKEWVKMNSNKVNLCFDESDEITNSKSKKTRAVLDVFRRLNNKMLGTGTTTRNNISELYSQLELLYNNSFNMKCYVENYLVESKKHHNKGEIVAVENPYFNKPYPPKYGQTVFTRCFNPTKSTVFGIQQKNQNIYNETFLRTIIEKTIITKTFKEIAGDKYSTHSVIVSQSFPEMDVYKTIIKELHTVLPNFYSSTGNSRKDAMLRILRQLKMLINATSTPHLFPFYSGNGVPNKAIKIKEMIKGFSNEKVAIGVTSKKSLVWYKGYMQSQFPDRQVFTASGDDSFDKRKQILAKFEATENGILVSTQQGLKSSVNVPTCNRVIVESLQWNISKISQWYFRFIRFDSKQNTEVYFVNYENTIEVNILALLMAKERLNDYIKTLEIKENDEMFNEFDIDIDILDSLITKEEDSEGKIRISWGEQKIS